MDGVFTWLFAMKPLWFLAAWLASSVFGAFVALEKNRCGLCWFAMGILFGPLALLTTVGLPVKAPRPQTGAKPAASEAAHPHAPVHAPFHAPAAHPAHPPGVHPPPLSPGHPAAAHAAHATAHPPSTHHVEPGHAPARHGFFASAMDRPAAGVAIAAVVVLLLLIYFGSRHL